MLRYCLVWVTELQAFFIIICPYLRGNQNLSGFSLEPLDLSGKNKIVIQRFAVNVWRVESLIASNYVRDAWLIVEADSASTSNASVDHQSMRLKVPFGNNYHKIS